jgi:CRISPR system Cascade subunit CasD
MSTGHRTVVSERYYLADALFLVVLHGDPVLLADAAAALAAPRWPLFFGRKAFMPARPLLDAPDTAQGLSDAPADLVLERHPWLELDPEVRATERGNHDRLRLRTVSDCPPRTAGAEVRHDVPIRFTQGDRRHATRTVATGSVPLTSEMIPAGDPSCS